MNANDNLIVLGALASAAGVLVGLACIPNVYVFIRRRALNKRVARMSVAIYKAEAALEVLPMNQWSRLTIEASREEFHVLCGALKSKPDDHLRSIDKDLERLEKRMENIGSEIAARSALKDLLMRVDVAQVALSIGRRPSEIRKALAPIAEQLEQEVRTQSKLITNWDASLERLQALQDSLEEVSNDVVQ